MSKPFKVNLSADWKDRTEKHKLPKQIAVSPKLDGIRFYVTPEGVALSRSNKPLANEHFQAFIFEHRELLNGVDGEVLIPIESNPSLEIGALYPITITRADTFDLYGDFKV